jgi:hypothetical protein
MSEVRRAFEEHTLEQTANRLPIHGNLSTRRQRIGEFCCLNRPLARFTAWPLADGTMTLIATAPVHIGEETMAMIGPMTSEKRHRPIGSNCPNRLP